MISKVAWLDLRSYVAIALALGCLLVFLSVSAYLLSEIRNNRNWYARLGNQAAVAIAMFMFGETLNRGWGAVLTVAFSRGYDIGVIESQYPIALVGATICIFGILAKLRLFTPDRWGNRLWVYGGITVLVTAAIIVWI